MSEIRDKVEKALKDMGIQTGDKKLKIHPMDWEALREEIAAADKRDMASYIVATPGFFGVDLVVDEYVPVGDILVEQTIRTWY